MWSDGVFQVGAAAPNRDNAREAPGSRTTAYLIDREWNAPYNDGRNRVADIGEFARIVLDTAGQR